MVDFYTNTESYEMSWETTDEGFSEAVTQRLPEIVEPQEPTEEKRDIFLMARGISDRGFKRYSRARASSIL